MIYIFICNLLLAFSFIYLSHEIITDSKSKSLKYDKVSNKHHLSTSFLVVGLIMFMLSIVFLVTNNILFLCSGNLILIISLIFLTIKYR